MTKKKAPTNSPNANDAPRKTKKPKRSDEELLADLKAQVRERERRISLKKLKNTDEGKKISVLIKAADILEGLDENPTADDIREICGKIAEGVGVEL